MSHALLSPSSASRWLACTPSARLEQQFPDTSGEAAKEGSLAHELCEQMLLSHFRLIKPSVFKNNLRKIESNSLYTKDMLEHAESYATFVIEQFEQAKKKTKDAVFAIEVKLDLTRYVPEGFGTGDAVIIADGTLDIIDFKYGKGVEVSCENNKQMMLYALGALDQFDYMYNITDVRMSIYQPRLNNISSSEISVADLKTWAETELKPKAELAFKGEGNYVAGEHCRFCKAKTQCKALAEENLKLAQYDFKKEELLTDVEIADILSKAATFKNWINAIEDYALSEAVNNNKHWEGFKLVEGRSNRAYTDQDAVADTLIENGYEEAVIYTKTLLGITAMEKAITKKAFGELLSDLVHKPQGKPTLVPISDKRPEMKNIENIIAEFDNVNTED